MKTAIFAIAALLTGCATCHEHPIACGVGAVFVVGSVAAMSAGSDRHNAPGDIPQRGWHTN